MACGGKREEIGVILVTGATGKVGRQLVSQLTAHGAAVRAVARDPDAAALPAGVEVVRVDLADAGSLAPHLTGIDAAFLLWPFTSPGAAADLAPGVVNAIARQVPRIVYLSAHAAADRPGSFWAQVERLVEASAAEWTFLRPAGFAANAFIWADQIRAGDVVRWPYGAAARSLVHERDLASVARLALTKDGHAGARYVLTGPSRLTQAEQVQAIGMAIGRPLRWEELPRQSARKQLAAMFGDAAFADSALNTWAEFVRKPEILTTTVQELTGAPARSFRDWAADHAGDFR
jgi:uncharacterized protein YbjT (DUF2867 family)